MSAANKKNFSHPAVDTNPESVNVSVSKIIDMTNRFYLEISKNILSESEYEIMKKILLDKCPITVVSEKYDVGYVRIKQILSKCVI